MPPVQLALPVALPVGRDLVALADIDDAERLLQYRWRAIRIRRTWYAVRADSDALIYMHRLILNAPDGMIVDHRDGNGLNNSRANLRVVTHRENNINAAKRAGCSSHHRGVDYHRSTRAWRARVWCGGRETLVGFFATEEEAVAARERAAREVYGEYVSVRRCP
jgi:hypothetical protein